MNYKEQIISTIDRLVNEFGYTKKEIAHRIGVHASKINYVYQAQRVDRKLLLLLQNNFPELQLPKMPNVNNHDLESIKEMEKAATIMIEKVKDNPEALEYMTIYFGKVFSEIIDLRKRILDLEKNKTNSL